MMVRRMMRVGAGRYRVFAESAPGMAAENAFAAEPRAAKRTVKFHRLEKIMRTGGLVATPGMRAESDFQRRTEEALVEADQQTNQMGDGPGEHVS